MGYSYNGGLWPFNNVGPNFGTSVVTPSTYDENYTQYEKIMSFRESIDALTEMMNSADTAQQEFITTVNAKLLDLENVTIGEFIDKVNADYAAYVALINSEWTSTSADLESRTAAMETLITTFDQRITNLNTATDSVMADWVATPGSSTFLAIANRIPSVNVKDYGAKGDGVTDDTNAIRAAGAASNRIYFPPGNYIVSSIVEGEPLLAFTGSVGVEIDAARATITCPTAYTTDVVTPIVRLDACTGAKIVVGKYIGTPVADLETQIGYRGTTFVQAINGTSGVRVRGYLEHLRYGVLTGQYGDPTKGYCKDFDVTLRTSYCGYTIAAYLADGIRLQVDADNIHRAVYVAGCNDVVGTVRWRDIHIAPIAVIVSDAMTGGTDVAAQADPIGTPTTSRGSSNIDLTSIDMGSTSYSDGTFCIGISLSRVDPCQFRNVKLSFNTVASDTLSKTVGGCTIGSAANSIWSRYTYNWLPYIVLENVFISGTLDKSKITTGNAGSTYPISVRLYDTNKSDGAQNAATIKNLVFNDLSINSAVSTAMYVRIGGMSANTVRFDNVQYPLGQLVIDTSNVSPAILLNSTFNTVDATSSSGVVASRVIVGTGTIVSDQVITPLNTTINGGKVGSVDPQVKTRTFTADLIGASVTIPGAILGGTLVLTVQAIITTAITGPAGFQLGVAADAMRYADTTMVAAGSKIGISNSNETSPRYYPPSTALVVTGRGGAFTGGAIKIIVTYVSFPDIT